MDFIYIFENLTNIKKMCNYFSGALDLSMLQYHFRWFNTRFRWCGKHFLWFGKWIETIGNSFRGKEEKRCRSSRCVIFMKTRNLRETILNKKECFFVALNLSYEHDTSFIWQLSHLKSNVLNFLRNWELSFCNISLFSKY